MFIFWRKICHSCQFFSTVSNIASSVNVFQGIVLKFEIHYLALSKLYKRNSPASLSEPCRCLPGSMFEPEDPLGRPVPCCTRPHSPMETSLMSSAAACAPCTRARVHEDRSQWVSTRKMWDSMPRPVPVRVANTSSEPWAGEPRELPEWTSLEGETHENRHLTVSLELKITSTL